MLVRWQIFIYNYHTIYVDFNDCFPINYEFLQLTSSLQVWAPGTKWATQFQPAEQAQEKSAGEPGKLFFWMKFKIFDSKRLNEIRKDVNQTQNLIIIDNIKKKIWWSNGDGFLVCGGGSLRRRGRGIKGLF